MPSDDPLAVDTVAPDDFEVDPAPEVPEANDPLAEELVVELPPAVETPIEPLGPALLDVAPVPEPRETPPIVCHPLDALAAVDTSPDEASDVDDVGEWKQAVAATGTASTAALSRFRIDFICAPGWPHGSDQPGHDHSTTRSSALEGLLSRPCWLRHGMGDVG
jgi:hypothetical protein